MAQTPRIRHARHRSFIGAERGSAGVARLKKHDTFLNRSTTALATTAAAVAFTVNATAVAATGTLTGTTIAADDTVTIGSVVYTFVTALTTDPATVPYEVLVGASDSDSLDNLIAAIMGAAGEGTTYGTGTEAHPDVTVAAGDGDTMDVDAAVAGLAGNAIATTAALTAGDFAAATLTGGEDAESLNMTAHGYASGDGPFVVASDDTLPDGLAAGTQYWVNVADANNLTLHLSRREAGLGINAVGIADAGTGNHTIELAETRAALNAHLRQGVEAEQIADLTDIDDILALG